MICGKKEQQIKLRRYTWGGNTPDPDDETRKKNGRGAYCCIEIECSELMMRQEKRWKRAFRL